MKTLLLIITSVLLIGLTTAFVPLWFSSPRERSYQQYERNRDAILEVVEQEAYATYDQHTKRLARYWAEDSYVRSQGGQISQMVTEQTGQTDSVHSLLDNNLQNNHPQVKIRNINLRMYRTAAWVTYDLHPETGPLQHETRFLEKQNRRWKMVYRNWLQPDESL